MAEFMGGGITAFLRQYLGDTTFSEACIPLSLVATNFDTGEKVILKEGKIIDGVRASISIPWLIRPHNLDDSPLVDGSISSNLAIECVSNNDKIIAVSVLLRLSRPLKKQGRVAHIFSFLTHNSLMLSKFVSLMMHQNEKLSRRSRSDVLCIEVKKHDIKYYEFSRVRELIQTGYDAGTLIEVYILSSK